LTPLDSISNIASAIPLVEKYTNDATLSAKETTIFDTALKSASFDRYIDGLNGSSASLGGYIKYMATAEAGTLALSAAQKVATIAAGALKAALNGIIVLGIVELVQFIGQKIYNAANAVQIQKKAVEELSTAYDDSKKKVQDINTQLSDTQKKIDDLNSKKKLTFVEQDQLNTLKETTKQLQIQADIAQKEADKKARELGEAAVESYNKQFGGQSFNQNDVNQYVKNAQLTGNNAILTSDPSNIDQMIAAYKQFSDLKQKAFSAKDNDEVERYNDLLNDIKDSLNGDVSDLQKTQTAIEKIPVSERTKKEKQALTDITNAINLVYQNIDPAKLKTINFNSVFDDSKFYTIKTELSSLAQQGKLTEQTLQGAKYSSFVKALSDVGISAKDAASQINALNKSTSNNNTTTNKAVQSNSDLAKSLQDLMSSNVKNYQSLQTVLQNVKSYGTLSSDDLNSLLKIFPDMSSAVLEYNSGLKSTSQITDLIKQKMQSLQNSYQQELQQELENNSEFYNDTIGKHTDLINQLSNLYGIDYKNYATYAELKSAIDTAIDNTAIGNSQDTAASLAQTYYANVKNYGDYEVAKTNVSNQVLSDIKNLNTTQIAKLAAIYGIDVKNYGNTEVGKVKIAGEIATKIAEVYGAVNSDFSTSISNQLKNLQEEKSALQAGTLPGSSTWSSSQKASALSEVNKEISTYQNLIKGMNGDTSDLTGKINGIVNSVKPTIPSTSNVLKSEKSAADKVGKNTATNAKEAAKKAAEEAKSAAKEAYENELSNLTNNEDSGLYKTKLDFYNALVKFQAKWIKNSYIDNSTKNSLKKKITDTLKDYEQDVYNTSLKQLSHREEIGQTKSGSIQELQNLQAIYKNLTTNPLMQLVNDDEHRQEINEKIYENKKQSLENEREELNTEKDLGQIEEGSLEYVNRLKSIKADIEKSDLNAIDKAEKLSDIDKDIYSATQSYNEAQINAVDHLVNIGKLQSNSLEYLKRLNHLYHTLNLSLDDRKSLQEKIFSSEISYISQLKSDLSDELIEGSYGQRIKEYEDEIDDLQQKESDLSDETISNSLGSQIKAIQDKIDAINDQSEAESKALALEKAKAAWEEAQNNKTVQIYTNKNGFVYQADQSAVTEKKQSYAEAQRNEEIEKLTQQKDALQKMLDSEKNSIEVSIKALTKHKESLQSDLQSEQTELEKATKVLQGYDVNSDDLWDDIQNQIDDVLNEVTGNISESTNKHKASYDEENESVTNLTDNTTNSYQSQIKNAQDFIAKFTPVNQQIMDMYNQQANAAQKVADAIYNVNNELDRYIRVINDAENEREEMNEQYNEYNQEARENHQSVHYASGTEDSIGGIVKKNEQGYELTFEPTDNGNYEILKEHSKVLTAPQTQRIFDLAKGVSPQIATLKANLNLGKIGGNISNRTTKTDITNKYEIKKVEFPNATNKDEIQAAFGSLDLYFKQKAFSNE